MPKRTIQNLGEVTLLRVTLTVLKVDEAWQENKRHNLKVDFRVEELGAVGALNAVDSSGAADTGL
jgi:hypothetical protein